VCWANVPTHLLCKNQSAGWTGFASVAANMASYKLSQFVHNGLNAVLMTLMRFYYSDILLKYTVLFILSFFLVVQCNLNTSQAQVTQQDFTLCSASHCLSSLCKCLGVNTITSNNWLVFYACCLPSAVHTVNNNLIS